MRIWSAGNDHLLDELAHPQLQVSYTHFPEIYIGIPAYREMLRMTYRFFPNLSIKVKNCHIADGVVTVEWRYTGAFRHGELFGVAAAGQPVEVNGITLLTFSKGKVIREAGIVDNMALATQLGALG